MNEANESIIALIQNNQESITNKMAVSSRQDLKNTRRWVIKIGSALATNDGRGLHLDSINQWVSQAAKRVKDDIEVVFVTSGSVAEGVSRLGLNGRPSTLHELQAAAAVGQMGLVQAYETCFQRYNIKTAQVLLTHLDLAHRKRYLNARSTLTTLIDLGVVPVVNENDTVATDEIRFGDNDTLAALVANLIDADLLVILTDQQGLYSADPRKDSDACLIKEGKAGDAKLEAMAGEGGKLGRGGMRTKLTAAAHAAHSGTATIIASGHEENILEKIARGDDVGTLLLPDQEPIIARKRWLAGGLQSKGKLVLDDGAVKVLKEKGRSLLAVGVKKVEGEFDRGELVVCVSSSGEEIARGLSNYSAIESGKIIGKSSERFEEVLGYCGNSELIHRDNMVVL